MPKEQESATELPLVVDLDGTLIKTDLLYEAFFSHFSGRKRMPFAFIKSFLKGRAALKDFLAQRSDLDFANLPYDEAVLDLISLARKQGRKVVLATASHNLQAEEVAKHLGCFDAVIASTATTNLKGEKKAEMLVELYGYRGFDYIGNHADDLPVWSVASRVVTIRASKAVVRRVARISQDVDHLPAVKATIKTWMKALRVHQYAKNALVLVPLLTAHRFDQGSIFVACLSLIAFSLCASSVYLINDLADLQSDRLHLRKRNRPFASGALSINIGLLMVPALLAAAFFVAAFISMFFFLTLAGYLVLTTAYTFWLKKKLIVDVVVLSMLYTLRILAGGAAIDVQVSPALLTFSIFIFTSLALVKRMVELKNVVDLNLPELQSRNYRGSDMSVVTSLAAASGLNSLTIFALYLSSDTVQSAYSKPWILWLILPVLLYWLARALVIAHRGDMNDDPIVFAVQDNVSRLALCCMIGFVLVAI
jgi:4-hydroxybenzoate polyprenyltransferase/phosphoserine phosphatase